MGPTEGESGRFGAEQCLAEAQYNLGVMYYNSQGVPQDHATAMRWYRKAAGQGMAEAQYHLGYMYGVPSGAAVLVEPGHKILGERDLNQPWRCRRRCSRWPPTFPEGMP